MDVFSFWLRLLYVAWVSSEINPLRSTELRNLVSYLLCPFYAVISITFCVEFKQRAAYRGWQENIEEAHPNQQDFTAFMMVQSGFQDIAQETVVICDVVTTIQLTVSRRSAVWSFSVTNESIKTYHWTRFWGSSIHLPSSILIWSSLFFLIILFSMFKWICSKRFIHNNSVYILYFLHCNRMPSHCSIKVTLL